MGQGPHQGHSPI